LNEADLQQQARTFDLHGDAFPTVADALETAKKTAHPDDLIFVGGSTFVVAEVV
jgi:dihydrofolate synthase/folylpolyglutamate synthase